MSNNPYEYTNIAFQTIKMSKNWSICCYLDCEKILIDRSELPAFSKEVSNHQYHTNECIFSLRSLSIAAEVSKLL